MREITREEVFAFIRNMTPLELSDFIRDLGQELGVSLADAAAPQPFVTMGAPLDPDEDMGLPAHDYNVRLLGWAEEQKIAVIKVVRELCGLGLRASVDLVNSAPCVVAEGLNYHDAHVLVARLEDVGAEVELV